MVQQHSLFTDFDIDLFRAGLHHQLYDKFGSHKLIVDGVEGCYFAVYAPSANRVEVIGSWNFWNGSETALLVRWDSSGIWEGFVPGVSIGDMYKYRIYSDHDSLIREKADPYARLYEVPPNSASVVWENNGKWKDKTWMKNRKIANSKDGPLSVYEVHLGSWKKKSDSEALSYLELAKDLVGYVADMGFTHVEFLPVMEHPYFPSWGYQCTGFFAPTSRYGNPEEFRYLVDSFHKAGIGVILDWVPAHFPSDEHALADFDGSKVYEHPDKSKGFHPDWNSLIFNYERPEVRSFLLSSAHFWLEYFHADGLRVDAVASMLYLDYSREADEWSPNIFGTNTYLAAIDLLQELNKSVKARYPDVLMIAEESTAYPGVTKPVEVGGLGFDLKWMMGWMNDSLEYISREPIHRPYHHYDISRSLTYAFSESYLLPLSHDEVVHGKRSIIYKMPGDEWQKFANLRLLYLYMFTHPGQKLLFMGDEIGQTEEWNVNKSIDWHLLQYQPHDGVQHFVKALNTVFKKEKALTVNQFSPEGFEWIDFHDTQHCVLVYLRKASEKEMVYVILNFSTNPLHNYRVGVVSEQPLDCILNSDEKQYFGSGTAVSNIEKPDEIVWQGRPYSIEITIPPLGGLIYKILS